MRFPLNYNWLEAKFKANEYGFTLFFYYENMESTHANRPGSVMSYTTLPPHCRADKSKDGGDNGSVWR